MVLFCRQDGNRARGIPLAEPAVDTGSVSRDHLMGFQLCLMDVVPDPFVGGNTDQVIAERAICIPGRNDVLELHSFKY